MKHTFLHSLVMSINNKQIEPCLTEASEPVEKREREEDWLQRMPKAAAVSDISPSSFHVKVTLHGSLPYLAY